MDLNYIRKLVKLVNESGVDEVEIEEEGTRIRICRSKNHTAMPSHITVPVTAANPPLVVQSPSQGQTSHSQQPQKVVEESPTPKGETEHHEVKSPIVGTFYRSPAPDAESYVEIGKMVSPGTVLCIVEAMKLMNEIESDASGRVVKICVENGQPVEYNQTLFLIEKM
jgi:acetyl-CoA carboxylase biotin carboxyl carrier protein